MHWLMTTENIVIVSYINTDNNYWPLFMYKSEFGVCRLSVCVCDGRTWSVSKQSLNTQFSFWVITHQLACTLSFHSWCYVTCLMVSACLYAFNKKKCDYSWEILWYTLQDLPCGTYYLRFVVKLLFFNFETGVAICISAISVNGVFVIRMVNFTPC